MSTSPAYRTLVPILPSRDFDATAAWYARLGFVEDGRWPDYLILSCGAAELHFFKSDLDPAENDAGAYLRLDAVDALAAAVGAHAETKPWGQREFHLLDPDRNMLRFGAAADDEGTLRIFGDSNSGNCLKVKWIADALAIPYAWTEIDTLKGGSRTPEMLAINPAGQVPSVLLADGRSLAQSNAILRYLARGSRFLPEDAFAQAKIDEWLFWEQYSHEPYVAVARFRMRYLGEPRESLDAKLVDRGNAALDRLEQHLASARFLVGESMTIADIALLAYTRVAHEGGFDLSTRPHLRRWIAACETDLSLPPAVAA